MHLAIFSQSLSNRYIVKGIVYKKYLIRVFAEFSSREFPEDTYIVLYDILCKYFTNLSFRMPVPEVRSGQTASFALKKIKRSQIRKGMVMVSSKLNPRACWQFYGDIMVLHHPTTIATRYQV